MGVEADWASFANSAVIPSGLAVDDTNRLYVGLRAGPAVDARTRGGTEVLVYSPDRVVVDTLRLADVAQIHAMTLDGDTLVVTDRGSHSIQRYDLRGRRIGRLGTPDHPSDTGCPTPGGAVARAGGPFHGPTQAVRAPDGCTYVSDGYGNARVHAFGPDDRLVRSWGEYGDAPGQLHLPHSIALDDRGRLLVCDRENSRIMAYGQDGALLGEWWRTHRPTDIVLHDGHVYVSDLSARVVRLTPDATVLAEWPVPNSAHNLGIDHSGRIYVTHILRQTITLITGDAS